MASGTPAEIKALFASFGDFDWNGLCAGMVMTVVNHFGVRHGSPYTSAFAAYRASTIASTDAAKAPLGAVHFWDYTDPAGNRFGHTGVGMRAGGAAVLNATSHADEAWGRNVGLSTVADLTRRVGPYLGWSLKYGAHELAVRDATPKKAAGGSVLQVATKDLWLRDRRSKTTAKRIATIPKGEVVETTATVKGYERAIFEQVTGWSLAEYLIPRTQVVAVKQGLNLRDAPDGVILRVLPMRTRVTVLGVDGLSERATWWQVKVGGKTGWVHRGFLR